MLPFLQGNVLRKRRRVFVFQPTTSSLKLFCLVFDVFPGKNATVFINTFLLCLHSSLTRALQPSVLMQMKLSDGSFHRFEVLKQLTCS